jgi:RHS repeat-associated protein
MAYRISSLREAFGVYFRNLFLSGVLIVLTPFLVLAQKTITDGSTPLGLSPGAPSGSYSLSGFENVNAYNGSLNFHLPLLQLGGRGAAGFTMTLALEQHWRTVHKSNDNQFIEIPAFEWWKPNQLRYGPGELNGRLATDPPCPPSFHTTSSLGRLTFTTSEGTEYELRDQLTGGKPQTYFCGSGTTYPSRGTVFVTADGSAATFISDEVLHDDSSILTPSGYLSLRDGNRYRIDKGRVSWIRDRNGNKISFSYGAYEMSVTDSINRQVSVQYADFQTRFYDEITYRGFGAALRRIRVNYALLSTVLRTNRPGDLQTVQTPAALFPQLTGSNQTPVNPYMVSAVVLPDNVQQYQFLYDVYGELARVTLPTGGAIEYDFGNGASGEDGSGVIWTVYSIPEIYRRVLRRRVYRDAFTLEGLTTYSRPELDTTGYIQIDNFKADQTTLMSRERHYFYGSASNSFGQGPLDYPAWRDGHEYQTDYYAANGQTLLKRANQAWDQRSLSWWTGNPDAAPPNNPFVKETTTTLSDTGLVAKTSHIHPQTGQIMIDQFNNITDTWVYDLGQGLLGGLLNHTHTDFVTTNNGVDYTGRTSISSPHLLSLPARQSIYDANEVESARATYEYDNYSADAFHAGLKNWPAITGVAISGLDPGFTPSYLFRGNVTATTRYLLNNNQVTGSITAYAQYDLAGNPVKSIDGRSTSSHIIASSVGYDDCFGSPNAEARSNTAPSGLGSANQRSYAFPTTVTNALGHTSYTQFEYYLGRPVDVEDPNGTMFSGYYDDVLDRPTRLVKASNRDLSFQAASVFTYDDAGHTVTTTSDLYSYNDQLLKGQVLYDGLGRTIETRQYEGGNNFIATAQVYDSMGRAYQTSNPYRPWKNELALWSTTSFDGLGRLISLTTADGAVTSTSYSGNEVTTIDQTGRKRRSVSDALGRLTKVYEDPNGFNWLTSYTYDALGNLTRVDQGGQIRSFVYDSLTRLKYATNPESGTVADTFDNSGNLLTHTDARGVTVSVVYDDLNRAISKTYQNDPSGTPPVTLIYDLQPLPAGAPVNFNRGSSIGRLVASTYGVNAATGDYYGYDVLGRSVTKVQSMGTTSYESRAAYSVSDRVSELTYPSGHQLAFNYDAAGRLGDRDAQNTALTGNLGDGVTRTYSSGISYSSWNSMAQEKFGTDTPIYNKLFYNSRGQLAEIRAGTSGNNTNWNRGAIINHYSDQCWGMCSGQNMSDNNGNLKRQDVYIPNSDQVSSYTTWADAYSYDSLNRLVGVHEYTGNSTYDWQQDFTYDRWGNRTINQASSWGAGVSKPNFSVDQVNNRLRVPAGYTLGYDAAGNVTFDNYSGEGQRLYDANNRLIQAWANNQWQVYTYDANGSRVRRRVNNQETWQVYGLSGELLAEYGANGPASAPQKEYGYRSGQLLVTASGSSRTNVALTTNGAIATASSAQDAARGALATINGDRKGLHWATDAATGSGWNNGTTALPAWLQVDFNGSKTIDEIDLFAPQDDYTNPVEPTTSMTFTLYGLSGFDIQYWNGSNWVTIPGCSVSGNNKIWRQFNFAAITTSKIRVLTNASPDSYSRLTEIEAWTTSSVPAPTRVNMALTANGAIATASSAQDAARGALATINGDRKGLHWATDAATGSGWNNGTTALPAWLQVDFNGSKTVDEIDLFAPQDDYTNPVEPTTSMTFTLYGLSGFDIQYWNGSNWVTIPGCSVSGNNKIWRQFNFAAITTSKIRLLTNASPDSYSRLTEIEAWGSSGSANVGSSDIEWLVTDQLGTPRMVFDKTGSLASTKRHDYLPFGEELFAGTGLRALAQGYGGFDGVRQKFTQKERDGETGLDYFWARYYASAQGRFTSADPLLASDRSANPQSWNRYTYVLNNPLRLVDPHGLVDDDDPWKTTLRVEADLDRLGAYARQDRPLRGASTGIRPPDELIAAIFTDLTQVTYTLNGKQQTGILEIDEEMSDEINSALEETFTLGVETGALASASNGIAVPITIGVQMSLGLSTGGRYNPEGPSGDVGVNINRIAQKGYEAAAGRAISADINNRAQIGMIVSRVSGALQGRLVNINTSSGRIRARMSREVWLQSLTVAMNRMYAGGIGEGLQTVGPAQVAPAKKPF